MKEIQLLWKCYCTNGHQIDALLFEHYRGWKWSGTITSRGWHWGKCNANKKSHPADSGKVVSLCYPIYSKKLTTIGCGSFTKWQRWTWRLEIKLRMMMNMLQQFATCSMKWALPKLHVYQSKKGSSRKKLLLMWLMDKEMIFVNLPTTKTKKTEQTKRKRKWKKTTKRQNLPVGNPV